MSPRELNDATGDRAGTSPAGLLQEFSACGVLVIDSRRRIVACTPEAAKCLRWKPRRLSKAALETLPAPLVKLLRRAATARKPVSRRQVTLEDERGRTTLRVSTLPLPARRGMVVLLGKSAVPADVEQYIRQLDRLAGLGTLSAGLAHEIKNSMVAIKTFIELLQQKGDDKELTDVVGRELKRIDSMVGQMLRFGAPAPPAAAPVRVHEILDHSLRLVEHQLKNRSISVTRRFQAKPDVVSGDEYQLQQAFMNLLFNAIDAMGPNGALTVSTETTEPKPGKFCLRIHIQDTGVGIPPENLARLFQPFFTTRKKGTGLGLAICQRIVREHHGTVAARSKVNQGSTFSITLPAVPPAIGSLQPAAVVASPD